MRTYRNNWIKRIIAAGMVASLVLTTPGLSQTASATNEYSTQNSVEETLSGDDTTSETDQTGELTTEQDATEDSADTSAPAVTEDTSASTEEVTTEASSAATEEVSTEETSSAAETVDPENASEYDAEKSEAQIAVQADETSSPSLTLENAADLSVKLTIKDDNTIEVSDGEGLILLSNVLPEEYKARTINLVTTTGWDITQPVTVKGESYSFLGLGDSDNAFEGTLKLDDKTSAIQYSISTASALFNCISTKATLGDLPFSISVNAQTTDKPLLAEKLVYGGDDSILNSKIILRNLNSDNISDAQIGGLVGTIEAGAKADITFENQFTKALTVTGESHTGLFCGNMNSGSSLTATYTKGTSAGDIQVKATTSNAGGFVGYMKGADLTVAGTSVTGVSVDAGDAGGLVGRVENGTVKTKSREKFKFADTLTLATGSNKAAGGLVGAYENKNSDKITIDLSGYEFGSVNLSAGYDLGGLIGYYSTNNMAGSLVISGSSSEIGSDGEGSTITTTGGSNANYAYGGIIGKMENNSYVEIENVKVSTADVSNASTSGFGGLVGHMVNGLLNVGNVTLFTTSNNDISADNVKGHGGLVGYMEKGVLRLHGTTDLSGQKITMAYSYTGQIVGQNDNGLVYALGDGNKLAAGGTGWKLVRYSGSDRSGSDIGNWGSVVRLGGKLTESTVSEDGEESTTGVFTYDADAHTVTVNNGTGADIKDENAFAAYALAYDISSVYSGAAGSALKFTNTINPKDSQTVTLGADIDLTGTGIIGIGKDTDLDNGFAGNFNGGNHVITLDIGTTYGSGCTALDNAAGQVYMKRGDNRDSHYSLALFAALKNAALSNVTIKGNVNAKLPKSVSQTTDLKYPGLVSAVAGTAGGTVKFDNVSVSASVSVTEEDGANKLNVWQGGFLGKFEGDTLTLKKCTWGSKASLSDARDTDNHRAGGFAATIAGGSAVTSMDCTLSGKIESASASNAYVGGFIAVSDGDIQNKKGNTISISNLQIDGMSITTKAGNDKTSGGLLGYNWQDTDVTFGDGGSAGSKGVTITGSTLNANNAYFGGLVYLATGYWNATAENSIVFEKDDSGKVNTIVGKSEKDKPSGLLIARSYTVKTTLKEDNGKTVKIDSIPNALYLEIGTFGVGENTAYRITDKSVSINISGSTIYFDEIVGTTKYDGKNMDAVNADSMNSVVSLAVRNENGDTAPIDENGTINTYINQIDGKYKNSKTRYYYNLDAYRKNQKNSFEDITNAERLVLWSVSQYAADPIKDYFYTKYNLAAAISGHIDLTGYSYYPVTPLADVSVGGDGTTELIFDNASIETAEKNYKKPSDADCQHSLMQNGLINYMVHNVTVKNVTLSGTVGKQSIGTNNQYNSGALIYGSIIGDPTKDPLQISFNNVTLSGICVTGMATEISYAPLLINRIEKAVKLTVDTLATGEGYADGYAATSLIGIVGSSTATKLTLSFANIALDGRVEKSPALATSVYNNGSYEINYHTTHTIFTRATLLEKFQYVAGEGSGAYNFNSTDDKVTYGVELTNSGTIGRNPDKQYEYYKGGFIRDEKNSTATKDYVISRYAAKNFIRYVANPENTSESIFELDINQKATGLIEGCGTYGDPYIITNGEQLISLANYFASPATLNNFQVVFNTKVYDEQRQAVESYHTSDSAASDAIGTDVTYIWENGKWQSADGAGTSIDFDEGKATKYLLNAYYEIKGDNVEIGAGFSGIGTIDKPFSGVIIGNDQNVVKISCSGSRTFFGGLIAFSRGSVVKNLTLDYAGADITMLNEKYPGLDNNYPLFGGVIGYCMGGDTIIDHVSVKYTGAKIVFTGDKKFLTSAGGYVGLVGGGSNNGAAYGNGYEKNGGGVVFRNMDGTENEFSKVCTEAVNANQVVDNSAVNNAVTTTGDGKYFYRNPYVGRVLDGYVCSELVKLDNTDKNYQIAVLSFGTSDLQVTQLDAGMKISVGSAQGLWLLSAIVNSGAGAMDKSTGVYQDVDRQVVDAYQIGKPRIADYEEIGTDAGADVASRLADEVYWGGNASTSSEESKNRVSYLVKKYTDSNLAASVAGKNGSAETNVPIDLTFTTDAVDMSFYGNGFRGIGSSYGNNIGGWTKTYATKKVYRRNLLIKSINSMKNSDTAITLNMNQNDYYDEYQSGCWRNQGAGLFVGFHYQDGCKVEHLVISGNVKLGSFKNDGGVRYLQKYVNSETNDKHEEEVGVGGFAARTANSWNKVTFANFHLENLNIYGGTSAGGAIGFVDYDAKKIYQNVSMVNFGELDENKEYQPWSIENVNVLGWVYNNGCFGGLVGWYESGRMINIVGDSDTLNANKLNVKTIAQSQNVATAGGLIGAIDFGSITIDGVKADNLSISGNNLKDLGGLVAGAGQYGSVVIRNCTLANVKIDATNEQKGVGGVLGYHQDKSVSLENTKISGTSTISGTNNSAGVGGLVGKVESSLTINKCVADGVKVTGKRAGGLVGFATKQVEILNESSAKNLNVSSTDTAAGGFVGEAQESITINTGVVENVNVLANQDAAGFIGKMSNRCTANVSNVELSNSRIVTKGRGNCAGGVVGWVDNLTINGYNILVQDSRIGYSSQNNIDATNLSDSSFAIQKTGCNGLLIGKCGNTGTIKLIAVSVKGDNITPQTDVGSDTSASATRTIVYADKPVEQKYNPKGISAKPNASVSPWLDVNPKSDVKLSDGTIMTGNAVETGVAQGILEDLRDGKKAADRYWNLEGTGSNKADFVNFLDLTKDAYLTTYRTEESSTTTVSSDIDFPILVVNNSGDVDSEIWNYIAAMTNVAAGATAKTQVTKIIPTTYKWNSAASTFDNQSSASLQVNSSSKKISIAPNAYDNQSSKFTLLDVQYQNPTDTKSVFHLYIPVLVKKVLEIEFDAKFLAGTDYGAAHYPAKKQNNHYATAGFDEPLTAYIEYTYGTSETDWQSMLDNGENLLWYYDKILDLAKGSTDTGKSLIPNETKLTLVDRQTEQYYTYTMDGSEELHNFNLSSMKSPDGSSFAPVDMCDLLNLKVESSVASGTETTYYVVEEDKSKATVRIGGVYYRKAEDKDTGEKYRITLDDTSAEGSISESYFLTIQVPATDGYSNINNRLNYGTISRKDGTLPARIISNADTSGSNYVIYDGVKQTFTSKTDRIHNGSTMDDTVMENGDSIKIELESTLKLTENGVGRFETLGPSKFYHEFDVNLNEYLKSAGVNSSSYNIIGTENIEYTYTVTAAGSVIEKMSGKISNAAGQDTLSISYGSEKLKKALDKAIDDTNAVKITAEFVLTYDTAAYFPERDTSDPDDLSGIASVLTSRIANTESQLPITSDKNKKSGEDTKRYYTANPSKVNLTYTTVDETGVGDSNQQLGINPSDELNPADIIYTRADYDYSNVDEKTINGAEKIRYKLELFQKNEDGAYNEGSPLTLSEYMKNSVMIKDDTAEDASGNACQWEEKFEQSDTKHEFARIHFSPITGEEFENSNHMYSNYRVRLTIVLLDSNGKEIPGTTASDYIIYTNARIYQDILESQ